MWTITNLRYFNDTFLYHYVLRDNPHLLLLILIFLWLIVSTIGHIITQSIDLLFVLFSIATMFLIVIEYKLILLRSHLFKTKINFFKHMFWLVYTFDHITEYELALLKEKVRESKFDNVLFERCFWDNFNIDDLPRLFTPATPSTNRTILVRSKADLTQIMMFKGML